MSRTLGLVFLALLVSSCATHYTCPAVDETVLARQVVDRILGDSNEPADGVGGLGATGSANLEARGHLGTPYASLPRRGASDARVRVLVVSDFECPFCSGYVPTVDRAVEQFGDEVAFYFVNYPLPFHRHAMLAAEAAVEARAQGGVDAFYAMHNRLFENQQALELEDLVRYAQDLGLDTASMRAALTDHRHREAVERDIELADELGAEGTPTTIVGEQVIVGAVDYGTLERAIERALQR